MIIHPAAQGTAEWLLARTAIPTASEFSNLLTPKFEPRKWSTEMPNSYLCRKLAEKWLGGPLAGFSSFATDQGQLLETECLPFLEFQFGWSIQRVGLITTDDGLAGCSPDGLMGDDGGLEVKCPAPETHVKYLLNGDLPPDYGPQVHGSMFVTGRKVWTFVSYRRRMPPFVLHVSHDSDIANRLADALAEFLARFNSGWQRLVEINGGPPVRPEVTAEPVRFSWEPDPNDIVP